METKEKNNIYRWLILAVLVLAFTSTFVSRFIWAPVLSAAAPDLGISMAEAGSLMAAFYIGYLVTQIPGGFLADKFRVKYLLFASVMGVAALTLAMAYAQDFSSGCVYRVCGGLFSGGIMAFCSRLLSNYFEPQERGVAFGILLASPSLGSLIANQLAPLALAGGGWRGAFQASAFTIAVIALLVLAVVREPKQAEAVSGDRTSFTAGIKNYFTNRQILIISVAGFFFMGIPAGYITWANRFITGAAPGGAGLTVMQAGLIVTAFSIFSIAGSIGSGFLGKRFKIDPKTCSAAVFAMMIVTLLAFSLQRSFSTLLMASVFFGLFSNMAGTHLAYWAVNIGGDRYAATTTSIQCLIFQSSNVAVPVVTGAMLDSQTVNGVVGSYMPVWMLFCVLLAAALISILLASRESAVAAMRLPVRAKTARQAVANA